MIMNILVKMRTTAAGPNGTYMAGSTVLIDSKIALQFVGGGYADIVETKKDEIKKSIEPEKAIIEPKEKALLKRGLKK